MSSFNANLQAYNVASETELAEVLSNYSSEFVYSVVDNAMKVRFQEVPLSTVPNVIAAWEANFKAIVSTYGDEAKAEVARVREETYHEIIKTICTEFGLNFTIDDNVDLYSAAYHLYDFFVSRFTDNLIDFFAYYIYKEKAALYDGLGLTELKKNKDTSTIYGKKIYKDTRLAIINANIDLVMTNVCGLDIPFHQIIGVICGNESAMTRYLLTIVSAGPEFFKNAFVSVVESDIKPDILTHIRLKLQRVAMEREQIVDVNPDNADERTKDNV